MGGFNMASSGSEPAQSLVDGETVSKLFAEMELLSPSTVLQESPVESCYIVEEAEEDDTHQANPVSILCPGCATVIKQYPTGLPSRIAHFDESCPHCEVDLTRWSAVSVNSAYEDVFTADELQQVTTDYWDRHLWDGIISGETNPRTEEYTEAYRSQATAFDWDWEVTCPLCRQSLAALGIPRLDYHHWRRDPDHGICFCRACHKAINGDTPDYECDWRAQQLGLKNKYDLQITRLAVREQVVNPHFDVVELATTLVNRYNLVHSSEEVSQLLSQTLQSESISEEMSDQYLLAGLPEHSLNRI
jgi:hypothetical protein